MLVVEKAHHIEVEMYGEGIATVTEILKRALPDAIFTQENIADTEMVPWNETEIAKELAATWHPGITVAINREHRGMTQAELSEKTGISIPNICLIENGRRNVGMITAKKLAIALDISIDRLMKH